MAGEIAAAASVDEGQQGFETTEKAICTNYGLPG
jgi:hypothetical protein